MPKDPLQTLLRKTGPMRGGKLAALMSEGGAMNSATARQRLSRAKPPIHRFPVPLLPKKESFFYLESQRTNDHFWEAHLRDLRETNSIYGAALDGLLAKGGIIPVERFATISGAPIAMKKQIAASAVADKLILAGILKKQNTVRFGECYAIANPWLMPPEEEAMHARDLGERIILDAIRDWSRKMGLASYNKIAIRGEGHPNQIGQFQWDLTGPSYLLPLRRYDGANGFLAADVFVDGRLDAPHIQHFIRKAHLLRAASSSGDVLPMLVADEFTGNALTVGHAAGIVLATPSNLFGHEVGAALRSLITTLKNAAAIVAADPGRLSKMADDLLAFEGSAGTLRGVLFELICAYLAKADGSSVDIAVRAVHPKTGEKADIDVLKVQGKLGCTTIECKGRQADGVVDDLEVGKWLNKLETIRAHLLKQERFQNMPLSSELWTSGHFTENALARLKSEKANRKKHPIDWKTGEEVRQLASTVKEKSIVRTLDDHFMRHPMAVAVASSAKKALTPASSK